MTKGRLEGFSDGVIAILITIMVLELKVPHGTDWDALRPLVPVFLTYVLSFVIVGIYWNNHHHMLHAAERINGKVMIVPVDADDRSEEHTSELQSRSDLVCRLLLEKKKKDKYARTMERHHVPLQTRQQFVARRRSPQTPRTTPRPGQTHGAAQQRRHRRSPVYSCTH